MQVHIALTALGRSVPQAERESRVYGPRTTDIVRALQDELGVPSTGVLDAATVRLINAKLSKRPAEERVVRGTARLATGAAATGDALSVNVWLKDRAQEHRLGRSTLDADGGFEVRYTLGGELQARRRIDLRVEVVRADVTGATVMLETIPDGLTIIANADLLEVIDFVIVQADQQPASEYEQLLVDVKEAGLDQDHLQRLAGDQLHLLAREIGHPVSHVAAMAAAQRLAAQATLPEQVFYAALRQGLPADLTGLLNVNSGARRATLEEAVKARLVPDTVGNRHTVDYLADLPGRAVTVAGDSPAPGVSPLRDLAKLVLTDAEADDLLGKFAQADGDVDGFWGQIANHPKASAFRMVVDLGALSNNHLPLVRAIQATAPQRLADIAGLPLTRWDALLAQSGPAPDAPGLTAADKASVYRKAVLDRVEHAFPRVFFAARLQEAGGAQPVVQFLKKHEDFDLRATHIARYLVRIQPSP